MVYMAVGYNDYTYVKCIMILGFPGGSVCYINTSMPGFTELYFITPHKFCIFANCIFMVTMYQASLLVTFI